MELILQINVFSPLEDAAKIGLSELAESSRQMGAVPVKPEPTAPEHLCLGYAGADDEDDLGRIASDARTVAERLRTPATSVHDERRAEAVAPRVEGEPEATHAKERAVARVGEVEQFFDHRM